jgi:hypothetical protein
LSIWEVSGNSGGKVVEFFCVASVGVLPGGDTFRPRDDAILLRDDDSTIVRLSVCLSVFAILSARHP